MTHTQTTTLNGVESIVELAKDIAIVAYPETRDLVERRATIVLTQFAQSVSEATLRDCGEMMKEKLEEYKKQDYFYGYTAVGAYDLAISDVTRNPKRD